MKPDNIDSIDTRIEGIYAPKFVSPSGKILGMPDMNGKERMKQNLPKTCRQLLQNSYDNDRNEGFISLTFIIFNEIQFRSHAQSNPLRPGSQNRGWPFNCEASTSTAISKAC